MHEAGVWSPNYICDKACCEERLRTRDIGEQTNFPYAAYILKIGQIEKLSGPHLQEPSTQVEACSRGNLYASSRHYYMKLHWKQREWYYRDI